MIPKKDKSLNFKDNKLVFNIQDKNDKSTDEEWVFTLKATPGPVAIVYPSLCSPLIKSAKDPLRIYVLVDDAFKQMFDFSEKVAKQIVNTYLKFEPWSEYRANQSSVDAGCRPAPKDEPLCATWKEANQQITLTELKADDYSKGFLKNEEDQLFGILHPNAIKWYSRHALKHLFRIELAANNPKVASASDQQLWALSWRVPTAEDKTKFEQYQDKLIQEYNRKYVNKAVDKSQREERIYAYKIAEELDFKTRDQNSPMQAHHPVYVFDGDHLNLGHLTDVHVSSRQHVFDKTGARIIDGVSEIIGTHAKTAYVPLYNLMKKFGTDADTHLLIFTGDLVDYGRNFDPACALGQAICTEKTTGKLWQAMDLDHLSKSNGEEIYPKYIDLRIMYSLFVDYYDCYQKPVLLTSGNHEGYTMPYGISPRVKTWSALTGLVAGGANKTGKFFKNGWNTITLNSNAGDDPHILRDLSNLLKSESAKRKKFVENSEESELKDGTRANEGVPADHNLTIYEACLLYGPDYGRVVMGGDRANADNTNFNPENYRWFYMLFTPITDLWFSVGQQTLIALNWGEGEQMTSIYQGPLRNGETRDAMSDEGRNRLGSLGILPESTHSITDDQVEFIKAALQVGTSCKVMCSHFTIANFDPSLSFEQKDDNGTYIPRQAPIPVGGVTSRQTTTLYNTGTFQKNRTFLLQECIQKGKLQLTMSGHSHRAGLYLDIGTKPTISQRLLGWAGTGDDMFVAPYAPQPDGRYEYQSQANKAMFLVTASGGSMPVQNYRGEMLGNGLAPPSGSSVKFGGAKPEIRVIEYNGGNAKPRFCVAMDFMDILGPEATKDKEGVIERFECLKDLGITSRSVEIDFRLNAKRFPDVQIFKSAKLHVYVKSSKSYISMPIEIKYIGKTEYKFFLKNSWFETPKAWGLKILQESVKTDESPYFIEFEFERGDLSAKLGYQQYDFNSRWIIQIEMKDRTEPRYQWVPGEESPVLVDVKIDGFRFQRHEKYGEVPSFKWRGENHDGEYQVPSKYKR